VEAIDQVQLDVPPGHEAVARAQAFFEGLLGLPRVVSGLETLCGSFGRAGHPTRRT
jgi:hypothetical protein